MAPKFGICFFAVFCGAAGRVTMANMAKQTKPKASTRAGAATTDNDHQKTVSGKNQKGPKDKVGKAAGGNEGSKGQNRRPASPRGSIGSHKPGGDGPGTKKFKYEADDNNRRRKEK